MIEFKDIKVIAIDTDGVLTDGMFQIGEKDRTVTKSFYTRDFSMIEHAMKQGIIVLIVTQSHDNAIRNQVNRIANHSDFWHNCITTRQLQILMGVDNKRREIETVLLHYELGWENVAYIGDAENDLTCMKEALFTGCPADAIDFIREESNYRSEHNGGRGAVYDFINHICNHIKLETNK